jgi:hypothetical protein
MVTGEEYTVNAGEIIGISPEGTVTGPQEATQEQIEQMTSQFIPLDVDVLGYVVTGAGGDPVIFTPEPEEPASKIH